MIFVVTVVLSFLVSYFLSFLIIGVKKYTQWLVIYFVSKYTIAYQLSKIPGGHGYHFSLLTVATIMPLLSLKCGLCYFVVLFLPLTLYYLNEQQPFYHQSQPAEDTLPVASNNTGASSWLYRSDYPQSPPRDQRQQLGSLILYNKLLSLLCFQPFDHKLVLAFPPHFHYHPTLSFFFFNLNNSPAY